jgi:hypothetical protein
MPPRTKLSTGATKVAKTITAVITVVLAVIAAFTALVAYGFAYGAREVIGSTVDTGVYHRDANGKLVPGPSEPKLDTVGIVGGIVGGVVALILLWLALYLLLRVFRRGAWLEGSVLHVRGAMRGKSANLATASVWSDPHQLKAGQLSIPLQLPQEELLMLANAITNQRVQSGPDDRAFATAERLRKAARDPFA